MITKYDRYLSGKGKDTNAKDERNSLGSKKCGIREEDILCHIMLNYYVIIHCINISLEYSNI